MTAVLKYIIPQDCYHHLQKTSQAALYVHIPEFGAAYERAVDELKERKRRQRTRYLDPRRRARAVGGAA